MRRIILFFSLLIVSFAFLVPFVAYGVLAQDTSAAQQKQNEIDALQAKLIEIQGQKQTLAKTVDYLNTKIQLAQKQIENTQAEIVTLTDEVTALSGKITILDSNLSTLTTLLVNRVDTTYKKAQSTQPIYLLLTSGGFGEFLKRYKYLKVGQKHDQQVMYELEKARTDFDEQKTAKEQKQTELEKAKRKLLTQKDALDQQQQEKQSLLEVTQNDENRFQALLRDARAQLAAIKSFVTANGGAGILQNQTKCDGWGCYYNQRDAQWGAEFMGISSLTMAEYGCFVTSVAMMAKHNGKDIKPIDIARTNSAFSSSITQDRDTAYLMSNFSVNGVSVNITLVSQSQLDSLLGSGQPVIAELSTSYGQHFIVIKKKTDAGYIMNDPFMENGNDRVFGDTYKRSDINSLRLVSFN